MASQTSALPDGSTLTKPAYTDSADIAVINSNMDKIVSNINTANSNSVHLGGGSIVSSANILSDNTNKFGVSINRSDGVLYFLAGRDSGELLLQKQENGVWTTLVDAVSKSMLGGGAVNIRRIAGNFREFSFSNLPNINNNTYKYFLLVCGDPTGDGSYALIIGGLTTANAVTSKIIFGDATAYAHTGSVSDGVLTITFTNIRYGGVALFWLG